MLHKIDFISDINNGHENSMSYGKVDRFIVKIHWWSFAFVAILAFLASVLKISIDFPSPFSWRVISPLEASVVVLIGFLSALFPAMLIGKMSNHYLWRVMVTFTLTIFSYLAVFVSGGAIEMHFIFFAMIALVVIYNDWRLGWIMLVLVALHHGILNYVAPAWVYFYGRNDFALIAHGLPVLVAVIFTTILSINNRNSIIELEIAKSSLQQKVEEKTEELRLVNVGLDKKIRERTSELEELKKELEIKVEERTGKLKKSLQELEEMNKYMLDREIKMAALKKEIEELKNQG